MGKAGVTETILLNTVARFESAVLGNTATARLLREGIAGGKLQNAEWIRTYGGSTVVVLGNYE